MNPAKLKQLQKDDLLSDWQKSQRGKNYQNNHLFQKMKSFDPWELDRREREVLKNQIPALKDIKGGGWGSRHRYNKDINQHIINRKMLESRKLFSGSK